VKQGRTSFPDAGPSPGSRQSLDDLRELNRRIAEHWLGRLDARQEAYLAHVGVCLGELVASAARIAQVLASASESPLPVARLNRRYLRFARLAAKEVAAGKPELLIKLGIDMEQAELLRHLSDEQLDRLACVWGGPIVEFPSEVFTRGAALQERAAMHHAMAFVATRLLERRRTKP